MPRQPDPLLEAFAIASATIENMLACRVEARRSLTRTLRRARGQHSHELSDRIVSILAYDLLDAAVDAIGAGAVIGELSPRSRPAFDIFGKVTIRYAAGTALKDVLRPMPANAWATIFAEQ